MSVASSFALFTGDLVLFAVFYTFGNIVALASTGFMWGPKKQCKKMFAKTRIIATTVYLSLIVVTLVVALAPLGLQDGAKVAIVIILIILQFLALTWYVLSFIPYARSMVQNCFGC